MPAEPAVDSVPYWRLSGFYFCYFGALGAWVPFWPLYLQQLGYGSAAVAALSALVLGTKVIGPTLWGYLADRRGQRLGIIRLGALASLCCFAGVWLAEGVWQLALVVFGYSFFWNAILSQFEVITLGHLKGQHERYSLVRLWGSIGFIAAVLGLGFWFDHFSLQHWPWWMLLLLLGILLCSTSVTERLEPRDQIPGGMPLRTLLKKPAILGFLLSSVLLQISFGPYYTFYSVLLEQQGYRRMMIGALWSLGVVAEVLIFLVMHRLLARSSLRLLYLLSLGLTAVRWLVIGWLPEHTGLLVLAQLGHAASFGVCHAVAVEFIRRHFSPAGLQGQGQALYSGLSFGIGGALGALMAGGLWPYGAHYAFTGAALAVLVAVFWIVRCWPDEQYEERHE